MATTYKTEIQFGAVSVEPKTLEKIVKEDIKSKGIKLVTLDSVNIYYKPEEGKVYYTTESKDGTTYASEGLSVTSAE